MNTQQRWRANGRSRGRPLAAGHAFSSSLSLRRLRRVDETNIQFKAFAGNLRSRISALIKWNKVLSSRLQAQLEQLERLNRLRKFLSPQVAEVVIASDEESTPSYRREIAAMFCDLRGFTAFSDSASPEAVLEVMRVYHQAMGELIDRYGGTIEHRAGDGIMVIFNAPLPCNDPALQAVQLAVAMRNRMRDLIKNWQKFGYELGFGVGLSLGYATLSMVGSEGRLDYVANGRVVNLAARLSDEAVDGQILLSERAYVAVKERVETRCIGDLVLKGFRQQVKAFNVISLNSRASLSGPAHGDESHTRNDQHGATQLDWSQWLSEEEIGNY